MGVFLIHLSPLCGITPPYHPFGIMLIAFTACTPGPSTASAESVFASSSCPCVSLSVAAGHTLHCVFSYCPLDYLLPCKVSGLRISILGR